MTPAELKALPASLGMTTKQFAEALGGMSHRTVQGWYIGKTKPSRAALAMIEILKNQKKGE